MSAENSRCVVLVPSYGGIDRDCEAALKTLEERGYVVRRVFGYPGIDLARSQMATDALADGFEETLWIDSDIGFEADDVDRLRANNLPLVGGAYPIKGQRRLAFQLIDSTGAIRFGKNGGLVEVEYVGTGFLLIRAEVYHEVEKHYSLPVCRHHQDRTVTPYFLPLLKAREGQEHLYLGEDYSFCERARQAGFPIYIDTRIRLRHFGRYGYSWEDAGDGRTRYEDYTFELWTGDHQAGE